MKENPERMFGGQERLTGKPRNLTLRSEGIPMAERQEKSPKTLIEPKETPKSQREKVVPPEKIEAARHAWAEAYKGKTYLPNERETIEELIKRGVSPMSGGAVGPSMEVAMGLLGGGQELQEPPTVERYITNRKERDKFFNSIFELVDASPHEFFQQAFTFENQITLTRFMNIIMKASRDSRLSSDQRLALEEDFERYQFERRIREGAHNVNAILYIPSVKAEQLFEHLQSIESLLGDAAHRVLGVVEMSNILERVLREEMRKNDGYLRPEAITGRVETESVQRIGPDGNPVVDAAGNPVYDDLVVKVAEGDVERRVKEIFNEEVARNHGVYTRDENGQARLINKEFQVWEIDRVFTTARATMIMSERLLSIAAEGKMGAGEAHYSSLFLQDILQGYSAIIHTVGKFGITEENMAVLLHDPEEKIKKVFGLLSAWNPEKYKEAYREFGKNHKAILESPNEFFALQKQNPNRVGDMMTLQAWRYIENPEEPSAVQDFVARGRERMKARWNTYHRPGAPTSDVYEEFIHKTEFTVPRNAKIKEKEDILRARETAWHAAHPGAPSLDEYIKYANEYFKWIGTAVRFDLLRATLDGLAKPPNEDGEALKLWEKQIAGTKAKANEFLAKGKYVEYREEQEKLEKLESADRLIERMVKLQPHRLYDKSPDIRKRINKRLFAFLRFPDEAHQNSNQKATVQKILDNFYSIEGRLFRERERLLEERKTFDSNSLSLDEFLAMPDMFIDDPALGLDVATQREQATEFRNIFISDYNTNKDKYLVEFVYRRDYKHGFMLWSGDIPLSEYRLTALGPSGSFVRRARDNKTTGEATVELFKLMGQMPEFQSLEQVIPFLEGIHDKIAIYSPTRAKEVVGDISLGIAKFVAERPTTNIPGWGFIERRFFKPSFAKIVYGETGLSSGATEIRNFFNILYKNKHLITKDKYSEIIKDKIPASNLDTAADITSTMSQLIALAILLYFLSQLFKSKS